MNASRDATRVETRERLLDAAQTEFSEQRFMDVSLDGIAHRAGFTKGAIYSNFRSKADLLSAVVERMAASRDEAFVELIDGAAATGLVDALVSATAAVVERDRDFVRLLATLWAVSVHDPASGARFLDLERAHREHLATAIEAHLTKVGVREAVDVATLTSGISGLSLAHLFAASIDPEGPAARAHRNALGLLVTGALYRAGADPGAPPPDRPAT